jgi:hypothetical protein
MYRRMGRRGPGWANAGQRRGAGPSDVRLDVRRDDASRRARHKALLLHDGRVLVAGGGTDPPTANNVLASVELFDPATGAWTPAAPMTDARYDFDMVLLPDGRVLVAGGSNNATDGNLGALASAEI